MAAGDENDPWCRALRIYGSNEEFWIFLLSTIRDRAPLMGAERARASVIEDLEDGWLQPW